MYKGKYIKLFDYLKGQPRDISNITLTVKKIEEIVGFNLPNSSHKHSAWWSNEEKGTHTNAKSWLLAGWKTLNVKPGESITFERTINYKRSNQSVNAAIGEYLVLAELLKRDFAAFLAHGANQSDWDIIISNQQNIKKVQVKASLSQVFVGENFIFEISLFLSTFAARFDSAF